ncbi:MAG: trypsin-like peptidase domain-containing protein [Candidatus Omnitrophica bacterium]|nr:trypsin-like peptidase domain-containing protein [Candidatus Omnitrophota bacterium]
MKNKTTIVVSIITSTIVFSVLTLGFLILLSTNRDLLNSFLLGKESPLKEASIPIRRDSAAEESQIVDVVERASSAIVSIVITKDVPIIERYYENFNPFGDDFFDDFFGGGGFRFRIPLYREKGTEKRKVGGGSGFFVSSDGLLVTNRHVVSDKDAEYTVLTNDGKKYKAEVLARDPMLDIAILRVKGRNFSHLEFGNSDLLKPGQTAIAIGNALGEFRNSVSVGVISGLSRSIVAGDFFGRSELLEGVIQTDAAINPGNSGGPLLDISGKVIGVNVAVERGAENIGFALPSNAVRTIVDSVREYGEIIRPFLGIRYMQITEGLKERYNLPVDYGALVVSGERTEDLAVIPGSPASKAGIVEDDIILEVDGVKIEEGKSLGSIIRQKQVGQRVVLKILHEGREKEVRVVLGKAPTDL